MIYLVDASTLITAHNTYYALHRVPEFWEWLRHHGALGTIKIPAAIYAEVEDGNDALADWMSDAASKDALLFGEAPVPALVQAVSALYGDDPSEEDVETIGKDPFLIAAALVDPNDRLVVTAEVSKPGRQGANRHIPNICADIGVQWHSPVEFLNALNFSTGWAD